MLFAFPFNSYFLVAYSKNIQFYRSEMIKIYNDDLCMNNKITLTNESKFKFMTVKEIDCLLIADPMTIKIDF